MKTLKEVFGDYFCTKWNLNSSDLCKIDFVDPKDLINRNRLDLMPKLFWIESHESGIASDFADEYYKESIYAITGRTFVESGQEETKNSYESFVNAFCELLNNIKREGFDPNKSVIPVDKNDVIMNGAHRTAIGIFLNQKVPVVRLDTTYNYVDAEFYRGRLLPDYYLELMIRDYMIWSKKNIYAICLWPRAVDTGDIRKKVETIISESADIIYKKEIMLSNRALEYLIMQIYCGYDWLGEVETGFAGAKGKANDCWAENSSTIVYFVEGPELNEILKLKNRIRDIFNVGNHSVHITDTNKEAVDIANIVLNKNSLDLMERGCPVNSRKLNILIDNFKNQVKIENKNLDDFVIDSSAVMCLYGLRQIKDLDYICLGDGIENIENIDNHEICEHFHEYSKGELIKNPKYHLYFNGVKFITLDCVMKFKLNRDEEKDKIDVALIKAFQKNKLGINHRMGAIIYNLRRYYSYYKKRPKAAILKIKPIAAIWHLIRPMLKRD